MALPSPHRGHPPIGSPLVGRVRRDAAEVRAALHPDVAALAPARAPAVLDEPILLPKLLTPAYEGVFCSWTGTFTGINLMNLNERD